MITAIKTRFYITDDHFGNPKLIKTSADGCEILKFVYPNGPWKKSAFANPYPPDSGERLTECTRKEWDITDKLLANV